MRYILMFIITFPLMFALLLISAAFYYFGKLFLNPWAVEYGYHFAYSVDQVANTVLGGAADQTISQRTAKALKSGKAKWWVKYFAQFVDILAVVVAGDRNHIEKSITDNVGQRELWPWTKDN